MNTPMSTAMTITAICHAGRPLPPPLLGAGMGTTLPEGVCCAGDGTAMPLVDTGTGLGDCCASTQTVRAHPYFWKIGLQVHWQMRQEPAWVIAMARLQPMKGQPAPSKDGSELYS
jgi:hypothetical protein